MSGGNGHGAGTAQFVLGGDLIRHQRLYDPSGSSSGGGGAQNTDYTTEDTATTVTNGSATCKPASGQPPQLGESELNYLVIAALKSVSYSHFLD